jgi:hypothetical protein
MSKYTPFYHVNRVFWHHYKLHKLLSIDESSTGIKNYTTNANICQTSSSLVGYTVFDVWFCRELMIGIFICIVGQNVLKMKWKHDIFHTIIIKLSAVGNYCSKGYHISMDSLFTGIPFFKNVYELGMHQIVITERNRKCLPQAL